MKCSEKTEVVLQAPCLVTPIAPTAEFIIETKPERLSITREIRCAVSPVSIESPFHSVTGIPVS